MMNSVFVKNRPSLGDDLGLFVAIGYMIRIELYFKYKRSTIGLYLVEAFEVDVEHLEVNCSNNLVSGERPDVKIVDFNHGVVFRAKMG